jgi:hypothetical protein
VNPQKGASAVYNACAMPVQYRFMQHLNNKGIAYLREWLRMSPCQPLPNKTNYAPRQGRDK